MLLHPPAIISLYVHISGKFICTHKIDGPLPLHTLQPRYATYQQENMQESQRLKKLVSAAQYALPGLISPSSRQQSLYGALGKKTWGTPAWCSSPLPLLSLPSPGGRSDWQGQQDRVMMVRVYVCIILWLLLQVCARNYPSPWAPQIQRSTSNPDISSQGGRVTVRYCNLPGKWITPAPELNNSLPPFLL